MKKNNSRDLEDFYAKIIISKVRKANKPLKHAIFDFDGTISLVREGWQDAMIKTFMRNLPDKEGEAEDQKRQLLFEDIARTTGKATIFQMFDFVERMKERGATPKTAEEYKADYLELLDEHIRLRKRTLKLGVATPTKMMVFGSKYMLDLLRDKGLTLHLVSGTDEHYVKEEASLLKVDHYFGNNIRGILTDYIASNKDKVFRKIIDDNNITGEELVVFGDGCVEIECAKELGATAVGIASDEKKASEGIGTMSLWKQERLAQAGADIIVPDFNRADLLLGLLGI